MGRDTKLCLATMYNCPSTTLDLRTTADRLVSMTIYELLKVGVMVMLVMGMQLEPSITMGTLIPPLGIE